MNQEVLKQTLASLDIDSDDYEGILTIFAFVICFKGSVTKNLAILQKQ
jgi:hypothetical protein